MGMKVLANGIRAFMNEGSQVELGGMNQASLPNLQALLLKLLLILVYLVEAGSPTHPSLFEQPQMQGVNRTPKNITQTAVKYMDKQQRKITEIRIFYDDQTWETFVPKK